VSGPLDREAYGVAFVLAGGWRRGYLPEGVNLLGAEQPFPRLRRAVYIAVDRRGDVVYVGKVPRARPRRSSSRVREHVQDVRKANTWARLAATGRQRLD
jgi:1-acyl-sn-glycerol-3-phosphate acyltransferase